MDNSQQRPTARTEGLVIQEMPDEVLVFDLETNKAHCLNETAAFVWKACDGVNSVEDITRAFGNQSGKPVEDSLIWLAIDQLNENNLLTEEVKANFNGQTRREVIKKIGLAAVVALPLISSLVAPPTVSAVNCTGSAANNQPCNTGGTPGAGYCCGTTCCPGAGTCSGNSC